MKHEKLPHLPYLSVQLASVEEPERPADVPVSDPPARRSRKSAPINLEQGTLFAVPFTMVPSSPAKAQADVLGSVIRKERARVRKTLLQKVARWTKRANVAEAKVVSILLFHPSAVERIQRLLGADDFKSDPRTRELFATCTALHLQNEVVTVESVKLKLRRRGVIFLDGASLVDDLAAMCPYKECKAAHRALTSLAATIKRARAEELKVA